MQVQNRLGRDGDRVTQSNLFGERGLCATVAADILEWTIRKRQNTVSRKSSEDPLLVTQVVIDAFVDLIDVAARTEIHNQVVEFTRLIRHGKVCQQRLSSGIYASGDAVASELCPARARARSARRIAADFTGEGIINWETRRRKIPATLREGWHTRGEGASLTQPIALVARETEHLVLNDWPAHIYAKLVLSKRRNWQSGTGREIVVGVKNFVAKEFIRRTMKRVRSRFRREIDYSTGETPVFRSQIIRLDLEFLNGILRRDNCHDVQVRTVSRNAVQKNRTLSCLAAANLKISKSKGVRADWISTGRIAA